MDNKSPYLKLKPRLYTTKVDVSSAIEVDASFIMTFDRTPEGLLKAQELLARFFYTTEIDIVKSTGKPRCFYCASLNETISTKCASCGASL